jgi:hypothetical protein
MTLIFSNSGGWGYESCSVNRQLLAIFHLLASPIHSMWSFMAGCYFVKSSWGRAYIQFQIQNSLCYSICFLLLSFLSYYHEHFLFCPPTYRDKVKVTLLPFPTHSLVQSCFNQPIPRYLTYNRIPSVCQPHHTAKPF